MTATDVLPVAFDYDEGSIIAGAFEYDHELQERIYLEQQAAEIKARLYRLTQEGCCPGEDWPWPRFEQEDLVPTSYPCRIVTTRLLRQSDGRPVVYALSDPRDSTIFYVGKSRQIRKRMADHCLIRPQYPRASALDKRKHAIYADGLCVAAFVLKACNLDDIALIWEQFFIDRFHASLLNIQLKRWLPPQPRYKW